MTETELLDRYLLLNYDAFIPFAAYVDAWQQKSPADAPPSTEPGKKVHD